MKLIKLMAIGLIMAINANSAIAAAATNPWCGYKAGIPSPDALSWGMKESRIKDAAAACNSNPTGSTVVVTVLQPKGDCHVGNATIAKQLSTLAGKCKQKSSKCNSAYRAIMKIDTDYTNYDKDMNLRNQKATDITSAVFGCV